MENKHLTSNYKNRREHIKKLMNNPELNEEILKNEITENDVEMVHDVAREARLNELFKDLNIDEKQMKKVKKQIIKLKPNSKKIPLKSTLFRDHNGHYKFEDLLNEYHDSIFREGYITGLEYGKKFVVEDIQNGRFTKEDIMNMTKNEIFEYSDEIRDEI